MNSESPHPEEARSTLARLRERVAERIARAEEAAEVLSFGENLARVQPALGSQIRPRVLRDPAEVEELQPLLRAMQRDTRRSRLRQLEIVCREHGRRLAEVFPTTAAGPVLLGYGRLLDGRDGVGAVALADVDAYAKAANLPEPDAVMIRLQCGRCTQDLPVSWIRRGLASDRRRLTY